ncbi:MAG: hypothetical protein V2J10_05425, partial [Wenzhouxiangella sp.]|nr:hypothetical protein [Wenzhouxiangella sp.]
MNIVQLLSSFALPHAVIGTAALATFWIAALVRKGSPVHRTIGKVYLLAMIGIVVTAIPLALSAGLQGQWIGATFLGYLVILVSHSCRSAWMAVRLKRDFAAFTGPGFRISTGLLATTGIAVSVLGLVYGVWLLIIFGLIGPLGAFQARSLIRNGPQSPKWWLKEHYGAMIANGVATHIAFLQIGLTRLVPELGGSTIQHLAWFGPLAVAFAAGYWLDRRYLRP